MCLDAYYPIQKNHFNFSLKLFYHFLNIKKYDEQVKEYNNNLLAINKSVSVTVDNIIHEGVLLGISDHGKLMINTGNNVLTINDINSTFRVT